MSSHLSELTGIPAGSSDENSVLVIVDMQFAFHSSREIWLQKAIEQEILRAKSENAPIIVLEMLSFGICYPVLTQHLEQGYSRYCLAKKWANDGSREITDTCREKGFPLAHFRLCGVHLEACIAETAQGLAKRLPEARIDIVWDACNGANGYQHNASRIANAPNILIVKRQEFRGQTES